MNLLDNRITIVVNEFIPGNEDVIIEGWTEFVSWYCRYFNEETYTLLEPLHDRLPNMWSNIASHNCLPIKYVRKYGDIILPHQWTYILSECTNDDDFKWVASHLSKLPNWFSNESDDLYQRFKHLLSDYEIFELFSRVLKLSICDDFNSMFLITFF